MANFKRRRPKMARSGCLHCKPWKRNGSPLLERTPSADRRRLDAAEEQIREAEQPNDDDEEAGVAATKEDDEE